MVDEQRIDFAKIEKKWQDRWEAAKVFEATEDPNKKKYYVLEMFPYPSATGLHMGHAFNFTIGDVAARFKRMQGFNVIHPMGFDSLGLPAENAAIKAGQHPEDYTNNSIKNFINQQRILGLTYSWAKQVNTADPNYYKWDQWIFLKMFEKGLVYEKEAAVNWCPKCNTILANEQVVSGKCWRHEDTEVKVKQMKQWFLKITDYADRLLEGHKKLNWPAKTIAMQKNWIGKSYGTEIDFEVQTPVHEDCTMDATISKWPVFTTRPDTIFGVTFVVVSAQHPRLSELVTFDQDKKVERFLKELKSVSEKELAEMEKEGVFTGSYATNPATGDKVPVYAGNFVVADYGGGMVMAVPAHDQRDFEFAKKYGIEIKQVIDGKITESRAWTEAGKLVNSKEFDGISNEEAKKKISDWLISQNKARRVVNYKLRDWSVARQRYWGTPIPLIHCDNCGIVPVPEKDLPVKLPKEVKFGVGNPLLTNEKWLNVDCPKCMAKARREANTMDTFVNSSWYFLRYCDPNNDKEIFAKEKAKYWMPIDLYVGGAEHACMHLIYSRFYTMFLHDIGLINFEEPAPRLFHQGMINGADGEKMSKSKGNGVEPLETMAKYGVDATRFFMLSEASPDKGFNWSDKGIQGSTRIINKIWKIGQEVKFGAQEGVSPDGQKDSEEFLVKLNKTIKNVTEQIENIDYRKSTIEIRELFDLISKQKDVSKESFEKAIKLIAPFCPHIAEEIWERLGNKGFVSSAEWPKYEEMKKSAKQEDLNEKIISQLKPIIEKYADKKNVYLYVMPFEIKQLDSIKIEKEIGKSTKIFAVNDSEKYDPEGKAKRSIPGKPAIYLE
jgi:leucyl-tRNA synthetase